MHSLNTRLVIALNTEPSQPDDYRNWYHQEDAVDFLLSDAKGATFTLYAGLEHVYLHAILIPRTELTADTITHLREWNFNPSSTWGVVGDLNTLSIEEPLADQQIEQIVSGQQLLFLRSFQGSRTKSLYIEISQRMTHILDLHHLDERDAWCKLDQHGDIAEIIKTCRPNDHDDMQGNIVTMSASELKRYAELNNAIVFRMFDFTRYSSDSFQMWGENLTTKEVVEGNSVFGALSLDENHGSYFREIQIIDPHHWPQPNSHHTLDSTNPEDKEYCEFIAMDWKNDRIDSFSCNPKLLGNYFTKSSHPYTTSPAFFRPEVLSKYKANPEKYTLGERTLSCRGTWHIKSIGINAEGQVHAYLGDLGRLPHTEQLHWKQFNEQPKAGLPQLVVKTDFLGEFSDEYEPLVELKRQLRDLRQKRATWWELRDPTLLERTHLPSADTRNDWASEIMNLDQLLVEGLREGDLRVIANDLGQHPDKQLRALKLLEMCLVGHGIDEERAGDLMKPWHEVHNLRSALKGHASTDGGSARERTARKGYGTLVDHFKALCTACDRSLEVVISVMENA